MGLKGLFWLISLHCCIKRFIYNICLKIFGVVKLASLLEEELAATVAQELVETHLHL